MEKPNAAFDFQRCLGVIGWCWIICMLVWNLSKYAKWKELFIMPTSLQHINSQFFGKKLDVDIMQYDNDNWVDYCVIITKLRRQAAMLYH